MREDWKTENSVPGSAGSVWGWKRRLWAITPWNVRRRSCLTHRRANYDIGKPYELEIRVHKIALLLYKMYESKGKRTGYQLSQPVTDRFASAITRITSSLQHNTWGHIDRLLSIHIPAKRFVRNQYRGLLVTETSRDKISNSKYFNVKDLTGKGM